MSRSVESDIAPSQRPKAQACEGVGATPKEVTTSLDRDREPTRILRDPAAAGLGVTSSAGRRQGGFALANLLATLAADYAALLAARLLLALSAATFMPAASGYAARLGGAQRHGRALSMITDGLTLAIVVGVRLGVLVNEEVAGAPHSSAWPGRRCSRCSASSPGSRTSRLPLTERMIWPLALTCGVPTLALLLARLL